MLSAALISSLRFPKISSLLLFAGTLPGRVLFASEIKKPVLGYRGFSRSVTLIPLAFPPPAIPYTVPASPPIKPKLHVCVLCFPSLSAGNVPFFSLPPPGLAILPRALTFQ